MAHLTDFGPNIWLCDGPVVRGAVGFRFPTRMAVIRLASEELFIWSPVALSDDLQSELASLGRVGHVVAPNTLHHLYLPSWREAYPRARFHAPSDLRATYPDLRIDAVLGPEPPDTWSGEIDQVQFEGNALTTEVAFFHRESATAIFTDLIQHMPESWFSGWRAIVARLDLMTGAKPAVPRKFRMAFKDKRLARAAVEKVMKWPTERLVFAHGPPVQTAARSAIVEAFRWLG